MTRRVVALAALGLVVVGLAVVGFVLGTSGVPDQDEANAARKQAYEGAEKAARRHAYALAFERGHARGSSAGRKQGAAAGADEGRSTGQADVQAEHAAQQQEAAASTPAPGTPGSTVCVAYQDYVPGVGCVPPVAPGETAAEPNCPPGQVPVGVTGACAPP